MKARREDLRNFESREHPTSRQIEIIIVRHGKQENNEDPESHLGAEGEEQALAFARQFVAEHLEDDIIVKIKKSSVQRTSRTGDIIEEGIRDEITKREQANIKLLSTRESGDLRTTGALGPIWNQVFRILTLLIRGLSVAMSFLKQENPRKL